MDALMSLPLLSYLVIPSITTYSTSLNLLFFYMTWSTLVLTQPALRVEIVGTLAVRVLFFLIPSLFFLLFDTLLPSISASFKTQGVDALPTRTGGATKKNKRSAEGDHGWWWIATVAVVNILLGVALQAGFEELLIRVLKVRSALKVATTLPSPFRIGKDLLWGLLLREVFQYCLHRFVLHPQKPTRLSQYHQKWQHSIRSPHSFVAHFDHPFAWILWKWIPTYGAAVLCRVHLLTYLVFLAFTSLEESLTFSGYNALPTILLGGITRRQDLHLRTAGRGNFAPWGLGDWLCGTSVGGDIGEDVKGELDKHDVQGRAGQAWEGAKESGRRRIARSPRGGA